MNIQYPGEHDAVESNATLDTTVKQVSLDFFTRIKGIKPKILSLEMESLKGARKLDMLDDGYTKFQV